MVALAENAVRRRGSKLNLRTPPPALPFAYLADRVDIDDPMRGYQLRHSNGWLQGFVTVTGRLRTPHPERTARFPRGGCVDVAGPVSGDHLHYVDTLL